MVGIHIFIINLDRNGDENEISVTSPSDHSNLWKLQNNSFITTLNKKAANTSQLHSWLEWMAPVRSAIISLTRNPDSLHERRSTESMWWVDWREFLLHIDSIFIYFVLNNSSLRVLFFTVQKYMFSCWKVYRKEIWSIQASEWVDWAVFQWYIDRNLLLTLFCERWYPDLWLHLPWNKSFTDNRLVWYRKTSISLINKYYQNHQFLINKWHQSVHNRLSPCVFLARDSSNDPDLFWSHKSEP